VTYETRDSPTVIQPRHGHPMLTTACRSTSWAERPRRRCVALPCPPGRRAREMMPGAEERFPCAGDGRSHLAAGQPPSGAACRPDYVR